jgi:hypothetical protein
VPNALGSAWVMPAHSLISVRPHAPAARQLVEPATHWDEDEFLHTLEDEVALIEDAGEATLHADDRAASRNAQAIVRRDPVEDDRF